jgi:hypothetical protein
LDGVDSSNQATDLDSTFNVMAITAITYNPEEWANDVHSVYQSKWLIVNL